MTGKRYYYKDYEESYYVFDSKTLSESEFEETVEYYGYNVFADSLTGEEVVDLLNENEQLKNHIQELQNHLKRLENENIQTYTLIKEAYNNERTQLGKSVLKQLLEVIQ